MLRLYICTWPVGWPVGAQTRSISVSASVSISVSGICLAYLLSSPLVSFLNRLTLAFSSSFSVYDPPHSFLASHYLQSRPFLCPTLPSLVLSILSLSPYPPAKSSPSTSTSTFTPVHSTHPQEEAQPQSNLNSIIHLTPIHLCLVYVATNYTRPSDPSDTPCPPSRFPVRLIPRPLVSFVCLSAHLSFIRPLVYTPVIMS